MVVLRERLITATWRDRFYLHHCGCG
jgi:hypothetical protein